MFHMLSFPIFYMIVLTFLDKADQFVRSSVVAFYIMLNT